MTGGFSNALLLANLPQIQGSLGLTPVEGGWLTAISSMTSVCMSMLLIKFRQQFGMQRFTRIFLAAFLVLNVLQLVVHSFGVQLLVRGAAGIVASALTTLCFLYIMQSLSPARRLSGMIIGFAASQIALPLARMLSPLLLADGRIEALFWFELGLTLMCLGSVALLRLPPSERTPAFERIDFLTFALFAPGVALLCAVLVQGRIQWWSTPWLGYATAAAIPLIGAALLIEHNRANPLLNTRWMLGRNIIRFAVVAASLRVLLSEQTYGTVGLLTVVGVGNDQLVTLSLVMVLASIAGLAVSLLTLNMADLYKPVVIAVALIGIGAWLDSDSTNLTRPSSLYVSQGIIAFAALYFLGPMLMIGIFRALARGPSHIVSFSAVFGITQTLGGLAGTALLGSFQIVREKYHSFELVQSLTATDPLVVQRIQQLGGAYARVQGDPVLRQGTGTSLLASQVTREANILAFNDVFLAVAIVAALVVLWLGALWLRFRLRGENPLAADLAAVQRMRQAQN
ncbi:MFS transporter [Sphingomonas silueang]|uniref:MFS transporter n=1 Tax=Sphingomonas silueang TaxID=3156617 RepID=UPI0032B59BF2